jgi:hypothetical protein
MNAEKENGVEGEQGVVMGTPAALAVALLGRPDGKLAEAILFIQRAQAHYDDRDRGYQQDLEHLHEAMGWWKSRYWTRRCDDSRHARSLARATVLTNKEAAWDLLLERIGGDDA